MDFRAFFDELEKIAKEDFKLREGAYATLHTISILKKGPKYKVLRNKATRILPRAYKKVRERREKS
jgi:hypothetical protein